MSAINAPFGLKPIMLLGGQPYAGAIREFKMTANSATGIFLGDLVNMASGAPTAATATPTTTAGANTPVGVMMGARYTNATLKYEINDQYFPAAGITAGHTNVWIKVADDPDLLFLVQADGSVARSAIGKNAPLNGFGGSTVTGKSSITLASASIAATATLAVRIVDLVDGPLDQPGDAFTMCIVKFNQGVHAYQNSTGQ